MKLIYDGRLEQMDSTTLALASDFIDLLISIARN